ncbi:MAG: rubrerythrin family protein [Candidatus Nanoarchaeia archaeon]
MTTEDNLKTAFEGESKARNMYTYFAKVAKKEGYNYIAKIFEETASNEQQHAKEELKLLKGIKDTASNLKAAIEGEHHEHISMYPQFAEEAEKEGNAAAAKLFREITKVEKEHEERFKRMLDMLEKDILYKRDKPIRWKCSVCGYVHEGTEPPQVCPLCKHPKEYYEPEEV